MPEARAVIGHDIGWPRDVGRLGDIAVMTLVDAVQAKQVCGWTSGGGGVFVVPNHHGYVVSQGDNSAATQVNFIGKDVLVGKKASKFQMGISDVAIGVVCGDQTTLDVGREFGPPQNGLDMGVRSGRQPDAAHARSRGIVSAHSNRVVRDKLSNLGGTFSHRAS